MKEEMYEVRVLTPSGEHHIRIGKADRDRRLTDLLAEHGYTLNTLCGQEGQCDGCCIELTGGCVVDRYNDEPICFDAEPIEVLACQHKPGAEPFVLNLPVRALAWAEPDVLDAFHVDGLTSIKPIWPDGMTPKGMRVANPIGAAIDIGTTTVTLMLVDLSDGEVLSRASDVNHQVRFGEDVLTRINMCGTDPGNVTVLRDAVARETVGPLLHQAADEAGVRVEQIVCLAVAGNTTMLHLFAGEDPSSLGVVPFTPVFLDHKRMSPADVGLGDPLNPDAVFHLLPSAAAYIGSDLTVGVVASGMLDAPGTSLLVDIGTNGEVVLKHGDQLLGCATAAGPAFEGAGLSHGQRAAKGAINHIHLAGDPLSVGIDVIQGAEPVGMCGSAYIDLLAEGVDVGLLTGTGRFVQPAPAGLSERVKTIPGHDLCFMVTESVFVSEMDIAKLLQAKAAIAAGIQTLLEHAGVSVDKVDRLFVAGGFGTGLNIHHAIACGLLPGFRADRVKVVGNTSLAGAYQSLMNRGKFDDVVRVARAIGTVELNLDPAFEGRYIDHLSIGVS
jgi:uncharacterized 2Fe-2S/4Fe-4S cluster protein (DUF4445 family)/ferredoxin